MKQPWMIIVAAMILMHPALAVEKEWKEYKTDNFRIYAHHVDEDFVNTVMKEAESSLDTILEGFNIRKYQVWPKDRAVSIFIYQDEADYTNNGGQAGWSHGAAIVQLRSIRTYPAANGFFDSILPHELGHLVLHEHVGLQVSIPLWFDEGVAMYQEKARQLGAHQATLQAIKNGKFIPLTELTDMRLYAGTDMATVQLFYTESASIVNFMIAHFGDFHFRKLCQKLKENRSFDNALTESYPRINNINDLNKQWVQFLKDNG